MTEVIEFITPLLQGLSVKYPLIVTIFAVMGVARTLFKPLMTFAHAYVMATPSTSDNEKLAKFEASKAYKVLQFLMDYIFSIKIKPTLSSSSLIKK